MPYLIIALMISTNAIAQSPYEDQVLDSRIKSVQLLSQGNPLMVPAVALRGGRITLEFDELSEDASEFFYQVVHCDRNWNRSNLDEIEYLTGFNGEEIQNYEFSVNTYVDYVHFDLTLPNEDTQFRVSGNYALIVYDDEQLTNPVIIRRFMLYENKVNIMSQLQRATDVTLSKTHQQLDVEVSLNDMRIGDPKNELSIDIIQNNRWDNMITNEMPLFLSRDRVQFDNTGSLVFPAGLEFRYFDTRSILYTTEFVKHIELHDRGSDVILHPDVARSRTMYRDDIDFDGRFVIGIHEFDPDDIRSDYSNIYFGLKSKNRGSEVYVVGGFNDWRISPEYRMTYVEDKGYVLSTLLKQGVYNYLYATKGEDSKLNFEYFEGNNNVTLNYYTIILYYRDFVEDYDRILGIQQINSASMFGF